MLHNLVPMMWHEKVRGERSILEKGLILRPKSDRLRTEYQQFVGEYDDLMRQLNELLVS